MENCIFCNERGQTWSGDKPVCAFTSGRFSSNNWNCATMNSLREIASAKYDTQWYDDEYSVIIPSQYGVLYMGWYKRRGKTSVAKIIDSEGLTKDVTLIQAMNIIKSLS